MLQTRVIPCLLLDGGRLVKTIKFKNPAYVGDPINAIKIYNEKEVDEIIILDITASRQRQEPPFGLLREIASECFMPMTYGGGIRNLEQMYQIFNYGIEKIAINSYALENPVFIREAAKTFGSQSVVVAMDAQCNILGQYTLCSHGGTVRTKITAIDFAKQAEEMGAGEILLNSIDRDGTWEGYDIALIRAVANAVHVPVIALGGAGRIEDFSVAVKQGEASAVAAGSMVVYQGKDLGVLINFPKLEELTRVLN